MMINEQRMNLERMRYENKGKNDFRMYIHNLSIDKYLRCL